MNLVYTYQTNGHLPQQLDDECPFAGLEGHEVLAEGGAGEGEALADGPLDLDDAQAEEMHMVADPPRSLDVEEELAQERYTVITQPLPPPAHQGLVEEELDDALGLALNVPLELGARQPLDGARRHHLEHGVASPALAQLKQGVHDTVHVHGAQPHLLCLPRSLHLGTFPDFKPDAGS